MQGCMEANDLERAVRRFGRTVFAFDALEMSERYAFFRSQRVPGAIVPYQTVGNTDAVLGEPLAPFDALDVVTREFIEDRGARGRSVIGFCASRDFAHAAVSVGAAAAQITAEPELDPVSYEPRGGSAKKLRAYARRLLRAGVRGEALPRDPRHLPPDFRERAESLLAEWKERARATHAHLLAIDLWRRVEDKRFFAVFDPKTSDQIWSLLVAHPVHGLGGWHLCHLIRHPDAPKGVNELAVLTAIESLGDEGCRYATFGPYPSPHAGEFLGYGRLSERIVRAAYELAASSVGYGTSVEFYRKIQSAPWQPRYLVIWPRRALVRGFYAMTRIAHVFGFLEAAGERRPAERDDS